MHDHGRHGAKQPHRFDPAKAGVLDDARRFSYLPPDALFGLLDAPARSTVVDFGTGTGTYALELARQRPDLRVIALDEQEEMLEKLRAKLGGSPPANLEPVLARAPEEVQRVGQVERVLAINVLHELSDQALEDVRALLKTDGRALFVDWNADVEREVGPPKDHVYSPADAAKRLEASGFRTEAPKLFRHHYALVAKAAAAGPAH